MAGEIIGSLVKVYVGNTAAAATTWTELEGVQRASINLESEQADTTAHDNAGWKTSLGVMRSGVISVGGVLRGTAPEFDKLYNACLGNTTHEVKAMFRAAKGLKGSFSVGVQIEAASADVARYSMTLSPTGALTEVTE